MDYRLLNRNELARLAEIDRSEWIGRVYYFRNDRMELVEEEHDVKGWNPAELAEYIEVLHRLYDAGGWVFGAFDGEHLAGLSALGSNRFGRRSEYMKLDKLYVGKPYRGQGVARRLMEQAADQARQAGAGKLYISATASERTIRFYLGMGCVLVTELNPALFELEPWDIHLELPLNA